MKNRAPSVVFLAFLSAFPASAQTNTFPASGNADIGTTSPVATLDIVSGQTITGTRLLSGNSSQYTAFVVGRTSTANDVSLGVAGTTGNWNPGSAAGDAALQIAGGKLFLSTGYRNDFVINGSGNIGVATSSPLASLDIGQRTDAVVLPVGTTGQRPSGGNLTNGEIRYNSSLPAVEAYVNGSWIPLASGASSAGQLQCSGASCNSTGSTTIAYCPYKGNVKTTASQGSYIIPSGCLTATTTSMYVGGVSGSSVSANTTYYIYLWNTSGTWVLDAETTGHATDSTTGIEIKSGDNTKTLVGMIRTDSNKKVFTGGQTSTAGDTNTVATWDNRIPTRTQCGFTTNRTSTSSAGQVEVNSENRCLFMSWGDAASLSSTQNGSLNTSGGSINTWISLDSVGSPLVSATGLIQPNSGQAMLLVAPAAFVPSEGFHYTVLSVQVNAGTTATYWSPQKEWVFTIQ